MNRFAIAFTLLSSFALAQDKPAPEALTYTEKVAIQATVEKMQQISDESRKLQAAQQQVNEMKTHLEADIAKAHPGYHLDENTDRLVKYAAEKK